MTETEIESLLGAYALDAVDADERAEIEAHLATCPRCRAEVTAHREVAALIANSGIAAPEGLWDRIAVELSPELPVSAPTSADLIAQLPRRPESPHRKQRNYVAAMFATAAVAVVIALLSLQVVNLSNQVNSNRSGSALSSAVRSVLSHSHRTIVLTSAVRGLSATVAVGNDDDAYWVSSDLRHLPSNETYQLWTVVRDAVVSLGVLGSNPNDVTAFRIAPAMARLMVTIEPQGGSPRPTGTPVVSAPI